jgi:ABC-type glycerol-3-phosphate transport system substrate-binding protein
MTKSKLLPISIVLIVTLLSALVTACAAPPPPPEKIVETVIVEKEVEKEVVVTKEVVVEVEVEKEVVVTKEVQVEVEVTAVPVEKTVVEFWSTDNEEDRVDVYEAIAARFMAENPDIEVRIVPIEEAGVSQRIATALAANRPPDIVRMGIERVASFAADGILDEDAAEAVIASIGEDDLDTGHLVSGRCVRGGRSGRPRELG